MQKKFIAISGSVRAGSFNTMLLHAAKALATTVEIEIIDISAIPLYNQDLEVQFPPVVQELKDKILASDGVIFATPEYNRSIPGVLKNAIDWLSRPYGKNVFAGKPALVLGASMGPLGAALAQYHLKQILNYLDMHVVGQPEFYLGTAQDKFDATGTLTDEMTKTILTKALTVFAAV